jgi:response regulator RpfG family c-di-GMP phosphodiesterase
MQQPNEKILLVDDERSLLDALLRVHRKNFKMSTACGPAEGLACIERDGPFDVVVSDFSMPEMNGVQFLSKVAELCPMSVRLMLTGNAELQVAIDAVNTGRVFRFMTKPASQETFVACIEAALSHARLLRSERELLDGTLRGSVSVLAEVLALSNPEAFGRANRVRDYVARVAELLRLTDTWQLETAALLSQIGWVAVPYDLIQAVSENREITAAQTAVVARHPEVSAQLLARIPRMEPVAAIVARQGVRHDTLAAERDLDPGVRRAAQILSACLRFDLLVSGGQVPSAALLTMARETGAYEPELLRMMVQLKPPEEGSVVRSLLLVELRAGMLLEDDVFSKNGTRIVGRGQLITASMLERLRNYASLHGVREPIRAFVKASETSAAA